MNFNARSQDTSSTRIRNTNLRAAVRIIESLKTDTSILRFENSMLRESVSIRDSAILQFNGRLLTYDKLLANYKRQTDNQEQQLLLSSGISKSFNKRLRRANTGKWVIGAAGVVATFLAAVYVK